MTVTQFFAMGGYAAYVWSAYGIVAVLLSINVVAAIRHNQQTKCRLRRQFKQTKP